MKIKYVMWSGKELDTSIADAVAGSIDTDDYVGKIENLESSLKDAINLIGKLVEILHDNHKITDDQLRVLINSYKYRIEE